MHPLFRHLAGWELRRLITVFQLFDFGAFFDEVGFHFGLFDSAFELLGLSVHFQFKCGFFIGLRLLGLGGKPVLILLRLLVGPELGFLFALFYR